MSTEPGIFDRAVVFVVFLSSLATSFRDLAAKGAEQNENASARARTASDQEEATLEAKKLYNVGVLLLEYGQFRGAIASFDKAIELNPKYAAAYSSRGDVWRIKGELDKAIADCTKAIEIDPQFAFGYLNRGNAWSDKGDLKKALADYGHALRLAPKDAHIYYNRGLAYDVQGMLDEAIADYDKAIELDSAFAEAHNNRARCWTVQGNYQKAIAGFKEAIRVRETFSASHANLAWLFAVCPEAKYRDGAEAVMHAKRARDLSKSRDHFALEALAAAYAENGDFKQAIHWQAIAIAKIPKESQAEARNRLQLYENGKPYREPVPKGTR